MTERRPRPRTWAARSPPTASAPCIASVGRRLADHDVRREHRRHGRHPGLLDGGLLRGRGRRDPASASRPKFGALVASTPGGVLGGITVVLYGMIGLLGAKIWKENGVDFGNPINLVPVAAGIIIGIGNVTLMFTDNFSLERHRARHDRGDRRATTWPGPSPRRTCATAGRRLHDDAPRPRRPLRRHRRHRRPLPGRRPGGPDLRATAEHRTDRPVGPRSRIGGPRRSRQKLPRAHAARCTTIT